MCQAEFARFKACLEVSPGNLSRGLPFILCLLLVVEALSYTLLLTRLKWDASGSSMCLLVLHSIDNE